MTKAIADAHRMDTPSGVIAFARDRRRIADQAEVELLQAALAWADLHPTESIEHAATHLLRGFGDTGLLLGGEGCPLVGEFSVAEFAAAIGLGTESGKHLIGQALELAHRLPRLWARLEAGQIQARRARQIADQTIPLSIEAAGFVDTQIAGVAHTARPWQVDKLVAEATARHMPEEADAQRAAALEHRHVTVDLDQPTFAGTARIDAELDLPDALDLEAALQAGAATYRELGSLESLDARRAMALGDLARGNLALPLQPAQQLGDQASEQASDQASEPPSDQQERGLDTGLLRRPHSTTEETTPPPTPPTPTASREVVLHVHLSEAAVLDEGVEAEIARIDTTATSTGQAKTRDTARAGILVTADTIRDWCGNPDLKVTVKPIIDLNEAVRVDQYEIPDRLREHVQHRDGSCVFPWCTRPARLADCDHIHAHGKGGRTCTCNLAALCRPHHRLKTHGHAGTHWTYTMLEPGTYLWSSPHGLKLMRDPTGTHDVTHSSNEPSGQPPDRD